MGGGCTGFTRIGIRVNPDRDDRGLGFVRRERGKDHGPRVKFGVCIDFF